jgi:urea transport system substrate-binding protein
MAISETTLKDTILMMIEDQNKKGGLLGKKLEASFVDPASNWPLFAEKAAQLLEKDKVAVGIRMLDVGFAEVVLRFSRKDNGLLFYPFSTKAKSRRRTSSTPALPRISRRFRRRLPDEGCRVKRWVLEGTRLRLSPHDEQDPEAYLLSKGVKAEDISINYTPFGFSDWQTRVAAIKKFGSAGKKTAVVSTINGDANVPFYKELGNQKVSAEDIPVVRFSVGEEELSGLDTKPSVGHLAAWNYFQSIKSPVNSTFITQWKTYIKNQKRTTNDPMEAHYIGFNLWVKAVQKAGTTDVEKVLAALPVWKHRT